jgi:hypothetical protein
MEKNTTDEMTGGLKPAIPISDDVTKTSFDVIDIDVPPPYVDESKESSDDKKAVDKFDINNVDFTDTGKPWRGMQRRLLVLLLYCKEY